MSGLFIVISFLVFGTAYKEAFEEASRKSMQDEMDFHKENKEWKKRLDEAKKEAKKRMDWIRDGKYDSENGRKGKHKDPKDDPELLAPGKRQLETGEDTEAIMKNIRQWRKEALEILMRAEAGK